MDLIQLIILIAVLGLVVWAVTSFVPMPPQFKTLIIVLAVIVVLLYLLTLFSGYLPHFRVGK